MTLDEAIVHCQLTADRKRETNCPGCAQDHEQLARWLMELRDLRKINRRKFFKEYGIKIGGSVWGGDYPDEECRFGSVEEAKKKIEEMEEADQVYDIPNPPKRTIMFRETTQWRKYNG